MNKIYRVIYNKETGTYNAVSEYAKAQGKSSSSNGVVGSLSQGIYTAVRFAYTIIMSGVLIATGQVAFGAEVKGSDATSAISNGKNACFYDTTSQSVVCGDGTTSTTDTVDTKTAKSVVVGMGATNTGETNVAIGAGAKTASDDRLVKTVTVTDATNKVISKTTSLATKDEVAGETVVTGSDGNKTTTTIATQAGRALAGVAIGNNATVTANYGTAIGFEAQASRQWDISIGRFAGSGQATTQTEGRNIAIGDGTLKGAINPNNNTALGTDAGASLDGSHNIIIGAYANSPTAGGAVKADNTIAIGQRAYATTTSSVAIGNRTQATGTVATSVGASAKATGTHTVATGHNATASGTSSIAIGGASDTNKTQALSHYSIAQGYKAVAGGGSSANVGQSAIAIGNTATATANNAIAQGTEAQATGASAVATGLKTTASKDNAVAIGREATADAGQAIAIGLRANTNDDSTTKTAGASSVAIGVRTHAGATNAIAIGNLATTGTAGQGSVAVGASSSAISVNSVAIGQMSEAKGQNSTAIGNDTHAMGKSAVAIGDGAGVEKQVTGKDAQGKDITTNVYHSGESSTAVGTYTRSAGPGSSAIGVGADASAYRSSSVGAYSTASGASAVAIGDTAQATAENNIAIGKEAKAETNTGAIAIGLATHATGQGAVVVGKNSVGSAQSVVAIGDGAKATADNAVAMGIKANATNTGTIAIGENAGKAHSSGAQGANAVLIGVSAGSESTNNQAQVAVGWEAGKNTLGAFNTATGYQAGQFVNGTNNVAMGKGAGSGTSTTQRLTVNDTVALGTNAKATVNNGVALGSNSVADVAQGKVGADPLSAQADKTGSAWTSTHSAVSVGNSTTITRQIISVSAGTADTDAVNVAQLKAAGFVLNTTGTDGELGAKIVGTTKDTDDKIQNGETLTIDAGKNIKVTQTGGTVSIATKDDVDFQSVLVGNVLIDGDTDVISGLADGEVSANSSDAVTGSQLHATNTTIAKGLNFGANDQSATTNAPVNRQLGDTLNIKGGMADTTSTSDTSGENVITRTTADGINIELAKNAKFDSVTTGGTKISDGGLTFVDNTGAAIASSPSITKTGINAGSQKITGVADGNIASGSKDAINGGQLFDVKNIAEAKLGSFTVGADNNGTATGITVNKDNARFDVVGKDKITTAVDGNKITVGLTNDAKTSLTKADTALQTVVSTNPNLTATTSGDKVTLGFSQDPAFNSVKIGDTTNNTTLTSTADGLNVGGDKITNVADGVDANDAVNVSQLKKVTAKVESANDKQVTIKPEVSAVDGSTTYKVGVVTDKPTVSDDGKITAPTNVDALISAGDVHTAISKAGFTLKTSATTDGQKVSGDDEVINSGKVVEMVAGKNLTVKQETNGKITYATKDDVDFNAVVSNDLTLNDNGSLVLGNDVTVDMGDNVISGVGDGAISANSSDAINGSQLYNAQNTIANYFGGGASVGADGTFTAPTYTTTKADGSTYAKPANNVGDALTNLNSYVNEGFKILDNAGDEKAKVQPQDQVQFVNGKGTTSEVTQETNGVTKVQYDVAIDDKTIKVGADGKLYANVTDTNSVTKMADGNTTTVTPATNGDETTYTVEVNKAQLDATPTDTANADKITLSTAGKVVKPTDNTKAGNSFVTADVLADVVNNSGFNLQANGDAKSLVKAGDTVQFINGDNIEITRNGNDITVATARDVDFDTIMVGDDVTIDSFGLRAGDVNISTTGINAGGNKVTGVANGAIGKDSQDAINGSQLFAQGEGVKNIIGGDTTYDPATGTYTNTNIGGTGKDNINDAIKASKTTVSSNDSSIKVTKTTDKDTGADNYDVSVNAQALSENAQLPVVYTKADGTKVYKVNGKFTTDPTGKDTAQEVATADVIASMQNADGKTNTPTTLANVKAGVKPTDAVNVSQLSPLATALGTTVANDGTVKAPSFVVTKTDGTKYDGATTVQGALDNIGTEIQKPLTFAGDGGINVTRKLGTTVNLKGGVTDTAKLTDNNIGVVSNGTDTLTVKLAKDINLGDTGSVKTGNTTVNNDGITIKAPTSGTTTDVKLTATGLNNGGNTITNVAEGVNGTDAVNVNQLNAVKAQAGVKTVVTAGEGVTVKNTGTPEAPNYTVAINQATKDDIAKGVSAKDIVDNKGLTFTGDAGTTGTKKLGDSIAITGDSNISTVATGAGVQVKLNDNIAVKGVTADQANIGGNVTINNAGINAGNTQITNVAEGVKATDAVNVSQLTKSVAGAKTEVKGTGLATVSSAKGANGQEVYTVDVAKAKAPTVTRGNVAVNADDADKVMTAGDIAKAINASERTSSVKAGSNAVTVKVGAEDTSGNTEYTIDVATDKTISRTNDGKLTVNVGNSLKVDGSTGKINVNTDGTTITADPTTGAIKANTTNLTNTNGKVNAPTAEDAGKLVNAKTVADAINASGFTLTTSASAGAVAGTTKELINPSETITVDAGKNIAITQKGNTISVATKDDVNFNNVAISDKGSLTVGKDSKVDMGGNQITNLKSGLNGKTLDQIKADDKAPERSNAATIGDLAQVQNVVTNNITNITNNIQNVLGNQEVADKPQSVTNNITINGETKQVTTDNVLVGKDGKPILTTYNVLGQTEYIQNDVIQAINHMNEQGIKFFHVNNGQTVKAQAQNGIDSSASGKYATAVGYQTVASGEGAVAMGNTYETAQKDANGNNIKDANGNDVTVKQRTQAAGKNAIAIGTGSQANAENTIAIGTGNVVTGKNSGAIGDPSIINADGSYSVGNDNTVSTGADNTFILGNNVKATVGDSVYLGDKSSSAGVHTTANGGTYTYAGANDANVAGVANSATAPNTTPVGVVTVGTEGGQTRQIQNVSAGVVSANSTDAINGSQLYDTHQAIANVGNQLANRIGDVEDKANAGTSSAMAMASLPQAYLPGKSMLTGGMATYNGEGAVAVGLSKLSDNGRWVLKISGSADTQGNAGGAIGAGFHF